ncbi:hypothetical protein APR11_005930 [Nocardia amikacinitolerans]|nr:hypothetical protein [Nocardia amikacinitolerans]
MSGLADAGTRGLADARAGVAIGWPRVLHNGRTPSRGGSVRWLAVPSGSPTGDATEVPA